MYALLAGGATPPEEQGAPSGETGGPFGGGATFRAFRDLTTHTMGLSGDLAPIPAGPPPPTSATFAHDLSVLRGNVPQGLTNGYF